MNILFISHIWPPSVDGGSQILAQAQKELKKIGHQTLVITTNCTSTDDFINPKSKAILTTSKGVIRLPVVKTKLFVYLKKLINISLFKVLATGPILTGKLFIKACIDIIKFKPDLIIAGPLPTTICLYANLLKKITQSRLLILPCFHQYDPAFQNKILLRVIKKADLVWTLTRHEQMYLRNKLAKTRIFTLYPGISNIFLRSPKIKLPRLTTNLLFLGNLAAHKNINLLISAFEKINQIHSQTRLKIVGQETLYLPQIKKHLQQLPKHISQNITIITKKYTPRQAQKYINRSDMLINPSNGESFGLVFIEAMSQGVPVIGANIPPVAEIINNSQAGLIFAKDNLDDLVSKIDLLIKGKILKQRLSASGPIFCQNLSWSLVVKKLINEI